jgi:hypothetical protein
VNAGFVAIVAGNDGLVQTALVKHAFAIDSQQVNSLLYTSRFKVPLSHLLKELLLVHFVVGPAHVEDVWMDNMGEKVFHVGLALVKGMTARKVVRFAAKDLDLQAMQTGMLAQQGYESDLMRLVSNNRVACHEKTVEKVFGNVIVANIIETSVGTIWTVKACVVSCRCIYY